MAIKFIDKKYVEPDDLVMLEREIQIMKKVKHKNVSRLGLPHTCMFNTFACKRCFAWKVCLSVKTRSPL